MSNVTLRENPKRFAWLHAPPQWQLRNALEFTTAPDSDYWQRTHYGFQRDNGHFFYATVRGDFVLSAQLASAPNAQYDQCGLLVRASAETWLKCSAEYETDSHSRLGSVVTNRGYSDWATQDIAGVVTALWYRVRREHDDLLIEWAEDGSDWHQMRIAHLHNCPAELQVGAYACSPTGPGFSCRVSDLQIEQQATTISAQPALTVRPVQPSDAAEWLRMRMALWPDSTPQKEAGEIEHFLASPPREPLPELHAVFVCQRAEGGLCGLAEISIKRHAPGCTTDRIGYLEGWYVDPDLRGQQIGRALVEAGEQWARAQGCREMASDTDPSYPISPLAHAALGYTQVEWRFRKELG